MPRQMIDNERSTAIHPGEAVEEKVSLSDRFGLWLGFHPCSQETYLAMVERYAGHFALPIADAELRREALEWAKTRGSRSGRVAWQLIQDVAGSAGSPAGDHAEGLGSGAARAGSRTCTSSRRITRSSSSSSR